MNVSVVNYVMHALIADLILWIIIYCPSLIIVHMM